MQYSTKASCHTLTPSHTHALTHAHTFTSKLNAKANVPFVVIVY